MKHRVRDIFILNVIFIVLLSVCYGAFDKDKPAATTSLRNSNPEILANWAALETAIAQDHEFSTGGTNSGKHEVLTMEEETSAGASSTNELHVQAIDGGSGQPEFAITSEDGDELQMTKDGDLYSSDNLVVVGTSTLGGAVTANGGITLGAGDDLIGSATSDITFNTDKFTVAGDTGNTLVAGTLDVTGEATVGSLADGTALTTSAAPSADAEVANKKYVDDSVKGDISGNAEFVVKAWGLITHPTTVTVSGNISSVSNPSTGVYIVSWDTNFATANYAVVVTAKDASARLGRVTDKIAGSVTISFTNVTPSQVDVTAFDIIAIGDQ